MKTKLLIVLFMGGWVGGLHAQYAFVTGATPPPAPPPAPARPPTCVIAPVQQVNVVHSGCALAAPYPAVLAPAPVLMPAQTVSYSVVGDSYLSPCSLPPAIYHVPTRNVVYFGRPESQVRNYLNAGYLRTQSSVVYFGRGEAIQRGYYFDYCR